MYMNNSFTGEQDKDTKYRGHAKAREKRGQYVPLDIQCKFRCATEGQLTDVNYMHLQEKEKRKRFDQMIQMEVNNFIKC